MASLLDGKWRSEIFKPNQHLPTLELLWRKLKDKLDEETVKKYKKDLHKFLLGHIGFGHFEDLVRQFIPSELLEPSEEFVCYLGLSCATEAFDDMDYEKTGVTNIKAIFLPGAANLNALLLLECVDRGFEFPNRDCAAEFTRVVRQSIANMMEDAVCTTKATNTAEHVIKTSNLNFSKTEAKNQPYYRLDPRDFFDSILLSNSCSKVFARLETSESHTNFYYRMMKLSYPDLNEKNPQ